MRFFIAVSTIFALAPIAAVHGASHCPTPPQDPSETREEFRCESNVCGGDILSRTVSRTCTAQRTNGCVSAWSCTTQTSSPVEIQDCTTGQACNGSATAWQSTQPTCECQGNCYPPPQIKEWDDTTIIPQNVLDQNNPKLPLNIAWNDVEAMMGGVCEVRSYHYQITNAGQTISGSTQQLQKVMGECQLKPNARYSVSVEACIDEQGNGCGDASILDFTTSSAPELKTPYDPDWEGIESGESSLPAVLEWCQAPLGTNFYHHEIYRDAIQKNNLIWEDFVPANEQKFQENPAHTILRTAAEYVWRMAACQEPQRESCGPFSHAWRFVTQGSLDQTPLLMRGPAYQSGPPEKVPVINGEDTLTWDYVSRAPYYLLHIQGGTLTKPLNKNWFFSPDKTPTPEFSFSKRFWQEHFAQNATYGWYITACTAPNEANCNSPDSEWKFKTAGAPPLAQSTSLEQGKTTVPIILEWDAQEKALSYSYELRAGNTLVAQGTQYPDTHKISVIIPYQNEIEGNQILLQKDTLYEWGVRSCADREATTSMCGDWAIGTVRTADLAQAPSIAEPTGQTFLPRATLSWNRVVGAGFYEYKVDYASAPQTETQDCKNAAGTTLSLDNPLVRGTTAAVQLQCTGNYQFAVRACLASTQQECAEPGPWSSLGQFSVTEEQPGATGLVSCARSNNDPHTDWDDRKPCGLGHFVLLLRNLVDFTLWKLSMFVIVLMALATGVISYFSLGAPGTFLRIKTMWKAVLVGFLIMFFAWFALNWILGILDFNVTTFGNWYEIPL